MPPLAQTLQQTLGWRSASENDILSWLEEDVTKPEGRGGDVHYGEGTQTILIH
jgi:hypothetical protein